MKKFRVGETYYYKGTKSIVKILRKENLNSNYIYIEVVLSDGNLNKGITGECQKSVLSNKVIALWL